MESVAFYFLSGVSVATALAVAASRRAIYAVPALVACLCAVAGLYGLLGASLLAAVQIVVYAGIAGLAFPIAIVLFDSGSERSYLERRGGLRWAAAFVGLVLLGLLAMALYGGSDAAFVPGVEAARGSVVAVGRLLLNEYLVPFLTAWVLLLEALIGAAWLARK